MIDQGVRKQKTQRRSMRGRFRMQQLKRGEHTLVDGSDRRKTTSSPLRESGDELASSNARLRLAASRSAPTRHAQTTVTLMTSIDPIESSGNVECGARRAHIFVHDGVSPPLAIVGLGGAPRGHVVEPKIGSLLARHQNGHSRLERHDPASEKVPTATRGFQ
ncbi:hypothetical protein THAOC_16546 [Thalassiosira oceanica]|uniref:Uncharacterized protein n=1 Tax=Thalassiosira oceanica TaxID=159749 RepID=K0S9L6_THAOC|nr:hypothetical protein THAOC_16546 [Thalassiosira oceanica]|eukprot:EJK62828.1 hypothetical protein THAOC_16546 [Thalassiosira oceanica]